MDEISKAGKTNYIVAELLKTVEVAIDQGMSFDRLEAAQLRARNKTLVDHRENRHMGFEVGVC